MYIKVASHCNFPLLIVIYHVTSVYSALKLDLCIAFDNVHIYIYKLFTVYLSYYLCLHYNRLPNDRQIVMKMYTDELS